jgi:hypothetical protein
MKFIFINKVDQGRWLCKEGASDMHETRVTIHPGPSSRPPQSEQPLPRLVQTNNLNSRVSRLIDPTGWQQAQQGGSCLPGGRCNVR